MPDWLPDIRARLAAANLDPAREAEIAQELAQHLDDRCAELQRAGIAPHDARSMALDELKDHATMRKQLARIERLESSVPPIGAPARSRAFHGLTADIRHAARRLVATPTFTLFSILTLALGIGATTAVYSAVHAAVLRPLPLADLDRVANLYHMDPRGGGSLPMIGLSLQDLADYAAAQTSFAALAPWSRFRHALVAHGTSEVIVGEMVGGQYFRVVGLEAALGRVIQPADDHPGAPRVMVLSDNLWRRRFDADPHVLGQAVNLGGDLFEIVGVMPPSFRGVDMPNVMPTAAWVPLSSTRSPNNDTMRDRERRWLMVKGRLKPGVSMEQAHAEFQAIGKQLDAAHPIGQELDPRYRSAWARQRNWFLMPAGDVRMHESTDALVGPMVITIMVTVGLVLLVACTNIANLMLARGSARRNEHGVRLALGASQWRLVRAQVVEAGLVTVAGGLAAFLVAQIVMVHLLSPSFQVAPGFVIRFEPEFNGAVAAIALLSTLLAVLVFGLVPALHATRTSLREVLASDGVGSAAPRWRGRRNLLALQVAVSAGLVAVAFLCAGHVRATARQDSGMDLDRIAFAQVDFRLLQRDETHGRRVLDRALVLAGALPGVEAVAVSSGLPAGVMTPGVMIAGEQPLAGGLQLIAATPDIFSVLGLTIVSGRAFSAQDTSEAAPVVVVSESVARLVAGEESAVGRPLTIERRRWVGEQPNPPRTVTVVGVAADTDTGGLGQRSGGAIYLPFAQHYEPGVVIVARAANAVGLPDRLRRVVQQADPDTAVLQALTGAELIASTTTVLRVGSVGSGLLGTLALVLAMAGLYGVMADLVGRRTREIGIRMALGADRRRMLRMVLLDGMRPVVHGLLLGIGFGAVLRMLFRPMFVRILPAFDPWLLVIVPAAFVGCALLAAWLPARRASRVDPNVALRAL
jgi:predicted permease